MTFGIGVFLGTFLGKKTFFRTKGMDMILVMSSQEPSPMPSQTSPFKPNRNPLSKINQWLYSTSPQKTSQPTQKTSSEPSPMPLLQPSKKRSHKPIEELLLKSGEHPLFKLFLQPSSQTPSFQSSLIPYFQTGQPPSSQPSQKAPSKSSQKLFASSSQSSLFK